MKRRALTRFALRKLVRQGRLDKALAKRILRDEDLTEMVGDFAIENIAEEGLYSSGDALAFFQWILDNADAIIAFIEKIIALFDLE